MRPLGDQRAGPGSGRRSPPPLSLEGMFPPPIPTEEHVQGPALREEGDVEVMGTAHD